MTRRMYGEINTVFILFPYGNRFWCCYRNVYSRDGSYIWLVNMTNRLYGECIGCKLTTCEGCVIMDEVIQGIEDIINKPKHYRWSPDKEVIDVIRLVLNDEELMGYYKGNSIKYRLRAGKKGDANQDIGKANVYEEWMYD